ncbi:hypothetical protein P7C70_g3945, partial [Phenoliferia sp. Uapishka_3]
MHHHRSHTFTTFAVAGAGGLGSFVAEALASVPGISVVVLSRSTFVPNLSPHIRVKQVDYTHPTSLIPALKGIQVVISTLSGSGFAAQTQLSDSAKHAGVKLFVPSEFGLVTEGTTDEHLAFKESLARHLTAIGLPSLRVFTGPFSDTLFTPYCGFDFPNGRASWVGKGETPIGFTARPDIASFLAHTLTTLSPSKLLNTTFRLEGDRKSFEEVVAFYEKTHPGKKVVVTRTPVVAAQKTIETEPTEATFITYLLLSLEEGKSVYKSGPLDNKLYPDWKPKLIEEIVSEMK